MDTGILGKVADINQQANALAAATSSATKQDPPKKVDNQDPAASKALSSLSQVLGAANNEPPQANEALADLQKEAAEIKAKVNALVAEADRLEDQLNLAPDPESVDVGDLFAEFREIIGQLEKDMRALQEKLNERKEQNAMDLEQKPTAFKPGEQVGDYSPNQTQTFQ